MTYPHRARRSAKTFESKGVSWAPALERDDGVRIPFAPLPGDVYLVVDDVLAVAGDTEGGAVVMAAVPWPELDQAGRLVFGDTPPRRAYRSPLTALQAAIDGARRLAQQPAPTRPVRIGDAFWVRGLAAASPPAQAVQPAPTPVWNQLLDVTKPAREAAKIAQYAAVAPVVPPDYVESAGLRTIAQDIGPPRSPRGPVARPAI